MDGAGRWGVTVLQANAEMDAGDIWASVEFTMPGGSKSSVYRTEVADAAVEAVLLAVARFAGGCYRPEPLDYSRPGVTGTCRPPCRQADRRISWQEDPTSPAPDPPAALPPPAVPVPGDHRRPLTYPRTVTGHRARWPRSVSWKARAPAAQARWRSSGSGLPSWSRPILLNLAKPWLSRAMTA